MNTRSTMIFGLLLCGSAMAEPATVPSSVACVSEGGGETPGYPCPAWDPAMGTVGYKLAMVWPMDTGGETFDGRSTRAVPALAARKVDSLFVDHDGNGVPSPGDSLRYTIIVENMGDNAVTGVEFNDLIPAHTTVEPGSVTTSHGVTLSEDPVIVSFGELLAGEAATVAFGVTVDYPMAPGVEEVVNQGTVTSDDLPAVLTDDPGVGGDADPTATVIWTAPVLLAEKIDTLAADNDGDSVPSPGDVLRYTILLRNLGNTPATGVVFSDSIPDYATVAPGSVTTSQGTVMGEDPVQIEVAEVRVGENPTITFQVEIDTPLPAGVNEIVNQGVVVSVELSDVLTDDPDVGGDADPTYTMITAAPVLTAEKSDVLFTDADGDGEVSPGDELLYRISIDNVGNTSATSVSLADEIPAGTSLLAGTVQASQGTVVSEDPVHIDLGEIFGGQADVTISFRVWIDDPFPAEQGQVVNQAIVASAELEDVVSDDPETPAGEDPTVTEVFVELPPALAIGDVTVTEGDAGTVGAVFTVMLSAPSGQAVSVDYLTADGTATAGLDYQASAGTLVIPPGGTGATVPVPILGDMLDEIDENFVVDLTNPVNATLADPEGIGTVLDDDPPPGLAVDDVTLTEGDAGTVGAVFTVMLSAPSGQAVSVDYLTADGTATAGLDYQASAGTLVIPAGGTAATLPVPILGDMLDEIDENFVVDLTNPVNATLADPEGIGTVLDDDPPPGLAIDDVTLTEGDAGTAEAAFVVTLSAPSGQDVSVDYSTADGTATAGLDYQASAGTLALPAGATAATLTVPVLGDKLDEVDENFSVDLTNPVNASLADAQGIGIILDDDDDLDQDGVPNERDLCLATRIPESVPTERLGRNRFALIDTDRVFDTLLPAARKGRDEGPVQQRSFTVEDTAGCSCEQIIDAFGLGNGHVKFGCSLGAMRDWVSLLNP